MSDIHDILKQYWGFPSFRPLQEDIIQSVMENKDTLALLPTGGGKSICYQVPGLAREGICLVVSPLIALMKDQVMGLLQKDILAKAVVSGMDKREIDITLDNCIYGKTKFLYVSPERLKTELFRARFAKMNVNLIAVDEAHCISQWGYDFRPPYLEIAEIRELAPEAPVIALTATATPDVVDDIQDKLAFRRKNVFRKSFHRDNLAYVVLKEEDKYRRLHKVVRNVGGTGIVYVRNRKKTGEVARVLQRNGVKADFYHAGLNKVERERKQTEWLQGSTQVIVSTNAFGMGIDKPDVRFVVHIDIPDTPEAYFQEAGRGGRDGKKAYATLLFHDADVKELQERVERSFPPPNTIRKIYDAVGNYYQLAYGAGEGQTFPFDLFGFSDRYDFQPTTVHHALKILELDGRLALSQALNSPSRVMIRMDQQDLYSFQVANRRFDPLLQLMLRSYPGLFDGFTSVNEELLARRLETSPAKLREALQYLDQLEVLYYAPRNDQPSLTFLRERVDSKQLQLSTTVYNNRKKAAMKRMEAMKHYVEDSHTCRGQQLLAYFGETNATPCGMCDVCLERRKTGLDDLEFDQLSGRIKETVQQYGTIPAGRLPNLLSDVREEKVSKTVRWMLDNGDLALDKAQRLTLKP